MFYHFSIKGRYIYPSSEPQIKLDCKAERAFLSKCEFSMCSPQLLLHSLLEQNQSSYLLDKLEKLAGQPSQQQQNPQNTTLKEL